MIPKLYLIESKERDGLVKIGFTSGNVEDRVQAYWQGISDPSVIYQMSGSKIFETYLHTFFGKSRKSVPITFKPSDRSLPGPREWFGLEPDILQLLTETFEKAQPKTIEDVEPENLRVFLSGLASAIQWEAEMSDPARLEEMVRRAALEESFALNAGQTGEDGSSGYEQDGLRIGDEQQPSQIGGETAVSPNVLLANYFSKNRYGQDLCQGEVDELKEIQDSRTILAVACFVIMLGLLLVDASKGGIAAFSIIAFILLAGWQWFYEPLANYAEHFWHWIQREPNRSVKNIGDSNE